MSRTVQQCNIVLPTLLRAEVISSGETRVDRPTDSWISLDGFGALEIQCFTDKDPMALNRDIEFRRGMALNTC